MRRKRPRTSFLPSWPLTACYLVLMVVGFYATAIEPYWLEVTHHRVFAAVTSPLRIAHVSDLHTRGLWLRERRVLSALRAEHPDVILISGDSIIDRSTYDWVADVLREMSAPLGIWFVRGNWEN